MFASKAFTSNMYWTCDIYVGPNDQFSVEKIHKCRSAKYILGKITSRTKAYI